MTSIIGRVGNSGQAVYAGSKAAVIGINPVTGQGAGCQPDPGQCHCPWVLLIPIWRTHIPEEKFAERVASIAMGRIGTPDEVAKVALFLASDLSSYVTGQVDWGRWRDVI